MIHIGFFLCFVLVFLLVIWTTRRKKADVADFGPRKMRRITRIALWIFLPILVGCLAVHLLLTPKLDVAKLSSFASLTLVCGMFAYQAYRRPKPKELLQNWLADSMHCGQCGYNLTGNVSGVCPECGWKIPKQTSQIESPAWGMWWRQWRIDYLENYRSRLAWTVAFAVIFALMSIAGLLLDKEFRLLSFVLTTAFMSMAMWVQVIRIVSYARRRG